MWQMMKIFTGNATWSMHKQKFYQANLVRLKMEWRFLCSEDIVHHSAHLWSNYREGSLERLQVGYNDAMRILLKRQDFIVWVKCLWLILRNLIFKFISQLNDSENEIILGLSNIRVSTACHQSKLCRHWYSCLFVEHWIIFF